MPRTDHTISASSGSHVTVRMAEAADVPTLARLAALDSAAMPAAPTLVAEIDGDAVAALPLRGGAAVADPFHRTAAAIELLELRAAQIRGDGATATSPGQYGRRLWALLRAPRAFAAR